eukprot:COSAG01_NODE_737_length_13945_cov_10.858082_14_plen_78_part_00
MRTAGGVFCPNVSLAPNLDGCEEGKGDNTAATADIVHDATCNLGQHLYDALLQLSLVGGGAHVCTCVLCFSRRSLAV